MTTPTPGAPELTDKPSWLASLKVTLEPATQGFALNAFRIEEFGRGADAGGPACQEGNP
jgi:hypothetical protein